MRNILSRFLVLASMLALAACGGGGDAFSTPTPVVPGGPGATASSIALTSSTASIPSDGSSSADITALVRDTNNNAMTGVAVTFSASAGALVVSQGTTDASGVAKASLSAASAAAGTAITITATGGGVTKTMTVNVANTQQTVSVVTSSPQIASDGTKPATITALVRGANNQLLPGVTVTFQASSGGLAVQNAVTDAAGAAIATLSAAGDPTNRTITVTASAGASTSNVTVDVTGTKLTVTGAANLVLGSTSVYDVALVDSGNNGIPGRAVAVSTTLNNPLTPAATVTTDSTGHALVTIAANTAGSEALKATALGLSAQRNIDISGQSFVLTSSLATVPLSTVQAIQLVWTASGVAQAGKTISFSTTRGLFTGGAVTTTVVTDAAGAASVNISSMTSGPAVITASGTGVTSQLPITFIATTPAMVSVQASPSTIPTEGQTTITAVVRDAANNLVQGQTVNFQLTDITGGSLSLASAITDVQGRARTIYTASQTPSTTNGVTVQASVQGTAISSTAVFTVGGQTVFLSLGTGNTISENGAKTQFIVPYSVQALDAAGNAVDGVTVTMTIRSEEYAKGHWTKGTPWTKVSGNITVCPNEDSDDDGILDPIEDAGASGNGNGKLDPGGVASTSLGTVVTSSGGSATINVTYPEDHATWVRVTLTAKAVVQGSESTATSSFWLPILASYLTDANIRPPGEVSPYGDRLGCTDPL
jgi:hypothetical protein